MEERAKDWWRQAIATMEQAEDILDKKHYNLVCFLSHQAAEYALKAAPYLKRKEQRTHDLKILFNEIRKHYKMEEDLSEFIQELDLHYISSRYPNSVEDGAPVNHYTEELANEAIKNAKSIIKEMESNFR